MNPESEVAGLSRRIRECAAIVGGGNELARMAGIARSSLENYMTGSREPKASTLAKIAKAADVSAHWLLTGEGPRGIESLHRQKADATDNAQPAAAPELLALIVDAIQRTYKEAGAGLSPLDLGRLSGDMHNEILSEGVSSDEWRGAVKMAVGKLRRDIAATAADASSRKREAS